MFVEGVKRFSGGEKNVNGKKTVGNFFLQNGERIIENFLRDRVRGTTVIN